MLIALPLLKITAIPHGSRRDNTTQNSSVFFQQCSDHAVPGHTLQKHKPARLPKEHRAICKEPAVTIRPVIWLRLGLACGVSLQILHRRYCACAVGSSQFCQDETRSFCNSTLENNECSSCEGAGSKKNAAGILLVLQPPVGLRHLRCTT